MAIHEKVTSHNVTIIHTNLTDYGYIIRLTLSSSTKVFISFPKVPSANFVTFSPGFITAQMPESQFAEAYHLLQSESPVFFTALNLFGLMTVNLTTDPELSNMLATHPGESGLDIAKVIGGA